VESGFGLVSAAQVEELASKAKAVDVERSLEIEAEIRHDLMAEIKAFAGQCPTAGGVIHLGATSMDIEDNADALRILESLDLIIEQLGTLLLALAARIDQFAALPVMAFTHIQPAEPTTLGYRCAVWAQDLFLAYEDLLAAKTSVRGKGFKGAVGTSASYSELFGVDRLPEFAASMEKELGL